MKSRNFLLKKGISLLIALIMITGVVANNVSASLQVLDSSWWGSVLQYTPYPTPEPMPQPTAPPAIENEPPRQNPRTFDSANRNSLIVSLAVLALSTIGFLILKKKLADV